MLAQRPTQPKNRWQNKPFASTCALLTTLLFSHASFAADARTDYDLDDDGLIEINDLADLNEIRNNLDGKTLYGSNAGCPDADDGTVNGGCIGFELTTDLDFDTNQDGIMDADDTYWDSGSGWNPIGSHSNPFAATFEGNGHVLRNLFINRSSSYYQGLFGYAKNALIRNVGLTGPLMSVTGRYDVGALAGVADESEITNVFNTGPVNTTKYRVGGLVGYLFSSSLENALNSGRVTGSDYVGGLVGRTFSSNSSQFSSVRNGISTGLVNGNHNYIGGLIGYNDTSNTVIENSYWGTDSSGQDTSSGSSESSSYVGLPLATLQCAVAANTDSSNSSCVSADGSAEGLTGPVTLFKGWDQAMLDGQNLWNFGSNTQPASMIFNGITYRDTDSDGSLDVEDVWPLNPAASQDADSDGHPDAWNLICDANCIANSGLQLDQFPDNADVWQDEDLDAQPDSWGSSCDANCQNESTLVLDAYPNDTDNDGIDDLTDTDDNNDGVIDIDADSDGLVEINNLAQLNAMRYQLDGTGLRTSSNGDLDQSGCPVMIHQGVLVKRCIGYELTTDLDFDTNKDGTMDANDAYWNNSIGWYPIGSSYNHFSATFEGNGHVLRNLFINRSNPNNQGLFGYTQNALIRNLGLTGPLMGVTGNYHVGALVGRAYFSEIKNVFNTGPVKGTNNNIGGLVGYLVSSTLDNAVNSGPITGNSDVGGLVGSTYNASASQFSAIRNGLNTGLVSANSNSGGLIGYNNSLYTVIENSYWATDSSGQDTSAGSSESNSYVGLPLATLQCAVVANTNSSNSSCVSADGSAEGLTGPVTLFKGWDQALLDGQNLWNFGSNTQPASMIFNGITYRDTDSDGSLDFEDVWPLNPTASRDGDGDGHPDTWSLNCDANCITNSGFQLDQFPNNADVWQDEDLDGQPDSWAASCDASCQNESILVLDAYPNDTDNDGIDNLTDTDDNNDGVTDIDADGDGLVEINNLAQLNAIRYQLDGTGLRTSSNGDLDQSGCPAMIHQGVLVKRCIGYELTTNLDFDTNQDGTMDANDDYWDNGEGWIPIGSDFTNYRFAATFEGNGYVIRNLFISHSRILYQGLFGYTQHALIRNVGLTGPLMSVTGGSYVGALVGYANDSEITNVFNTGPVHGGYERVGGLVGYLSSSTLDNAVNSGRVSGNYYVGGIVGRSSKFSAIRNGLNTGLVSGNHNYTGGLIGYNDASNTVIENSYWGTDSSGQDTSAGSSESNSYVGLPLATLQCAVAANTDSSNSSCVSADGSAEGLTGPVTLFKGWDQVMLDGQNLWDFGSDIQMPVMVFKGIIYRDSDGDGVRDDKDAFPLISLGGRLDTDSDGIPNECDESCLALGMSADLDDDNDGVLDISDAFPLVAIGELLDTDNDGAPNTCDVDCLALGMSTDLDDDNDGVLDGQDTYPLISLGGRLDTDSDGIPNECDESCLALGMSADLDDDNDGVLDGQDTYPLISLGGRLDTDSDGIPNECDDSCVALGMSADLDDDNDGVLDISDAFPLVAIGELLDTDNDGAPNTCDVDCLALGMSTDLDDDNDGVLDGQDTYPLISLGGRLDSDSDGIPNECDESCLALGMSADTDDDNDGVLDVNDAYPQVAIGELLDADNDGAPNTCDVDCLALGMSADLDDDNDGVLDTNDAFPLISLGGRLDTDNDGIPNECDESCLALGMTADLDDDNDGILDDNDAYPLIAIGGLLDTDNDGAPDACDTSCVELGMSADLDDDNDGVLDVNDAFPLIAIGELLDIDNDGAPNACGVNCLALGMSADLDDDNDGVFDGQDTYPLISLGGRLDSDSDGIPNECDESCTTLGMTADTDDDNDGVLDISDAFPLVAIGELLDTDNDGAPDTCDVDCLALGMSADLDDDNDGVLDVSDAFPLIAIGELLDTDSDGAPDTCEADCLALNMTADLDDDNDGVLDINDRFPLDNSEHSDFDNDGTGDVADLDDDNDGVNDVDDPNLGEDNGKPEIINVPSIEPVAVTTENGDAFELLVDDNFLNAFTTYDAVDTEFTYEASLNGNVLAIDENDIMLIPAGRQAVQVVAIDAAGNRSEPVEMVAIVYPQVRFEQATSIIGENSTTNIKVSLTGDAPDYPVVINFAINERSEVNQADLDAGFDIEAQHQVMIEAGDTEALNRDGFILIPIVDDNESENDELLFIDLLSAQLESEIDDEIESLFVIDETNKQHELTVTYQNIAPVVNLKLEQNGIEVANVQQDAGMVSITAIVQDGNGNDVHSLTWDLNNLGLNAPLGNILNFSPASLPVSTYEISVIATDNGVGQLSGDAMIRFDVVATETNNNDGRDGDDTQSSSGGSGGGSNSLWFMLFLFGLTRGLKINRRTH